MTQTHRPPLSLAIETEIEGLKRQIHIDYWPLLQKMQELTDKARADYRLLSSPKGFLPPNPKAPHALRRVLATYALRLFEMEAKYFPSSPESRHWLEVLANSVVREISGRLDEVEEAGKFKYVTLAYHGLDRAEMVTAMRYGMAELKNRLGHEFEQKLYDETARHLMGEPKTVTDTPATVESYQSARKRFVKPLLQNRGWSLFMWAIEADVAYNTAAGYLAGKRTYPSTRVKLARALEIDANQLPE
jgi:hypothetical protein